MAVQARRTEISLLNLLFCLLIVWIHCCSHPISVLDRSSWQFALILALQRLAFVSVHGFFFLSGVKLTLGGGTLTLRGLSSGSISASGKYARAGGVAGGNNGEIIEQG